MEVPDPHSESRRFGEPYTTHHPVPNIRGYKEQLENRNKNSLPGTPDGQGHHTPPETPTAGYFAGRDTNVEQPENPNINTDVGEETQESNSDNAPKGRERAESSAAEPMSASDLAQRNKEDRDKEANDDKKGLSKGRKGEIKVREVTDPVTHLPINIHDFTKNELDQVDLKDSVNQEKGLSEEEEIKWNQDRHNSLKVLVQEELQQYQKDVQGSSRHVNVIKLILIFALVYTSISLFVKIDLTALTGKNLPKIANIAIVSTFRLLMLTSLGLALVYIFRLDSKQGSSSATREAKEEDISQRQEPETAAWLNNIMSSVWPLVNPDLFISLADMLEDVMQASLPRFVKMVRVADLGQGSEPLRILGVRWLKDGAAAEERDGMEAEEGDFVNMEIAIAYRSRPSSKTVSSKVKNAHLLLEFYLAGAIPLPIWVELKGMIGTCRVRLQTTPDPPFFSVMTFTFLGQPKVTLSCVPLMKKMPNIMDVPLISSFVQSSVDAAMSEYVAPKSLTLDLKKTLMGDDFKTDVNGKGVLVIRVLSAHDFKNGDGTKGNLDAVGKVMGLTGETGSDAYVALSWSKYGKSLWLTRIITKCQSPVWNETVAMIVGPDEINADEKLQLALWDSDRATADDHLGTVQVDLKELLHPRQDYSLISREDKFTTRTGEGNMPGTLKWEVGWFPKTKLTDLQIQNSDSASPEQKEDPSKVERDVKKEAIRKTREARHRDERDETRQQSDEDMKEVADSIMNSSQPLDEFPSGILSIQIHQISNLSLEKVGVDRKHHNEDSEEHEEGEELPSAYCVVTINHRKVYKTRVKPKSSMPFFNAATERFIRDWRTTEIIVSVHDNRLHENNPILGCVVLPLHNVFRNASQTCQTYPLVGGLGYGRVRISLVFRSVECKLSRNLLGWEVGTLAIDPEITGSDLPDLICEASRISISTKHQKSKVPASKDGKAVWKRDKPLRLPISQRYSSCVLFSFRKNRVGTDSTMAFAVLWLKDIPDDEDCDIEVPVWDNDGKNITRAEQNTDEEFGDRLGTIRLKLRFWSGLSGYHQKIAKNDDQMAAVIEILDCAAEGKELRDDVSSDYDGSSSSESSSDEELEEDGKRGIKEDLKEYKKNRKELHRHHKGLMQWKGVRGVTWAKDQVKDVTKSTVQKVTGRDNHEQKKNQIETEV